MSRILGTEMCGVARRNPPVARGQRPPLWRAAWLGAALILAGMTGCVPDVKDDAKDLISPVGTSCSDVLAAHPGSPDGVYPISLQGTPTSVYCDMTTDAGGWTLVVGISNANTNHENTAAVTPGNLTSPTGLGKFSDAQINALLTANYRFTCAGSTSYWPATCVFAATTTAAGACTSFSTTYGGAYDNTDTSQGLCNALAVGNNGTNNRLIYGYSSGGGFNGCDSAPTGWNQSGTVWVK